MEPKDVEEACRASRRSASLGVGLLAWLETMLCNASSLCRTGATGASGHEHTAQKVPTPVQHSPLKSAQDRPG